MSISMITTGTELLKGTVLNTNQAFLGRELEQIGMRLASTLTVGDHPREIYAGLAALLPVSECIVVTGGLGPTDDDITLDAVCRYLGVELETDPVLVDKVTAFWHRSHRGRVPRQVLRQARAPRGAHRIENPEGSASGWRIDTTFLGAPRRIYLLPGPPREFEPMMTSSLLPDLAGLEEKKPHEYTRCFLAAGVGEFSLQQLTAKLLHGNDAVEPAFCVTPEGTRVFLSGPRETPVIEAIEVLRKAVGTAALPVGELSLLPGVLSRLESARQTLVTAESCTGGGIAEAITAIPGASAVFRGGAVVYSNELKTRLLGVPEELLARHGAVSAECAEAMVRGAAERLEADCAIAVTGIAGPGGGTPEKPVGLVYIGVLAGDRVRIEECHFRGDRRAVRERTRGRALLILRELLTPEMPNR